jgi:hypothetical protein
MDGEVETSLTGQTSKRSKAVEGCRKLKAERKQKI